MIETVMIAAIGFLAAALLALVTIPAVNARAERLARRRVEALFPLSITELTAEKDHLRAEFAVTQRRLERKVEEALAAKRADMEELGRRAVRVEAMAAEVKARDERVAALERELADVKGRLAKVEEELAGTRSERDTARETIAVLGGVHNTTLEELGGARGELEGSRRELAEARRELAATREAFAAREASARESEARQAGSLAEIEAARARVADLETRLATQTVRGDDFERVAAERRTELSVARQQIADLSKGQAPAADGADRDLRERLRALEAERDANAAEATSAAVALVGLRSARDTLLATLDSRVEELRAARKELATLRDGAGGEAAIRAENAELRRRLDEVADEIMRAAAADAPQRGARRPATA